MTTYAGIDLLLIAPNAVESWGSAVSRPVEGTENAQGNVVTTTTVAPRTTGFTLTWNVATRADLTTLVAFLDARVGSLQPCWIPTYQRDIYYRGFVPFSGHVVTATPISALLAGTPHMQFWIVRSAGGANYACNYFNTYSDPADGTHVWGTTPGAGPTPVSSGSFTWDSSVGSVWSRLMACRLASDRYRVSYLGQASVVTADFVEIAGDLT